MNNSLVAAQDLGFVFGHNYGSRGASAVTIAALDRLS